MAEPASHASLTPEGVRDGAPAALALIVDRRGPAVLAYCAEVCTPEAAGEATAEAFARFRGAVTAAADPRGLDPDGLLLSATRHAAAARASLPAPARPSKLGRLLRSQPDATVVCEQVPALVVARAEGTLAADEDDRLERHLRRDHGCRELEEAFLRAETAFHHPPDEPLPVDVLTGALAAMVAVAPISAGAELPPPAPERRPPSAGASSATPVGRPRPASSTPVGVADDPPTVEQPAPAPAPAAEEPRGRAEVDEVRAEPAPAPVEPPARQGRRRHGPLFDVVLPVGLVGAGAAGVLAVAGVFSPASSERSDEAAAPVVPAPASAAITDSTLATQVRARDAVVARLERDRVERERRTLRAARAAERAAATAPAAVPAPVTTPSYGVVAP